MKNIFLEKDSPIARGARLRKARKITILSSEQMAEALGYSRQTVSYWENGVNGGLTQKGAVKVVNLLKNYGVQCDIAWLLYGIGDISLIKAPDPTFKISEQQSAYITDSDASQEIDLFTKTRENSVVIQLKHPFMQPFFDQGDWVGGCFMPMHAKLIGLNCIVKIEDDYEVRFLKEGSIQGKYNLILTNYSSDPHYPFELTNLKLVEIAPVIRVWKKQLS
jgi:transcriptional regulator with XRE-family HTH domain